MAALRRKLSYANVVATLALVIAVAGGTTAIAVSKAPRNSVASSSIKPYNVTAGDLAGIRMVQAVAKGTATASCARGERLLGGGGSGDLAASFPINNSTWVGVSGSGDATAYAICLKAKPGK
ncbi:MAG: hypothetical protein ACRDK5_02725 [Solirubrobacterales bacterium]